MKAIALILMAISLDLKDALLVDFLEAEGPAAPRFFNARKIIQYDRNGAVSYIQK